MTFKDNGNGTATVGGTPAAGAFPLTLTATNVAGSGTQGFTLTVKVGAGGAPVFTSAASDVLAVGTLFDFKVTTTSTDATTLSRTGTLPAGVIFVSNGRAAGAI